MHRIITIKDYHNYSPPYMNGVLTTTELSLLRGYPLLDNLSTARDDRTVMLGPILIPPMGIPSTG